MFESVDKALSSMLEFDPYVTAYVPYYNYKAGFTLSEPIFTYIDIWEDEFAFQTIWQINILNSRPSFMEALGFNYAHFLTMPTPPYGDIAYPIGFAALQRYKSTGSVFPGWNLLRR
jgi:hypothetical protein